MTHRIMFAVAVFASLVALTVAPKSASAQQNDAGVANASVLDSGVDSGVAPVVPPVASPVAAPFCTSGHVLGCVCPDGQHEDASGVCVPNAPRAAQLGYCIMPDGSGVADDGAHRCGCPAGTLPFAVEKHRSVDRLRSLGVPHGYSVFACANPMAMHGSPDSVEERTESLPVDLGPLTHAVENLASALAAEHVLVNQLVTDSRLHETEIADNVTRSEVISRNVDALAACIHHGAGRDVTYTMDGVTQTYTCPEFLAANRRAIVEETHRVTGTVLPRAFVLVQGFGLLSFSQLHFGNTDYGLPWAVGGELTLGIGLGGSWNIQVGGALGGAFPTVPKVTNILAMPHIGLGVMMPVNRDVHVGLSFGGLAALRFLPDGSLAHNIYAAYVEAMFRFNARSAWSPVLGFRLFAGVAPHVAANGTYAVPFSSGGLITLGFGHF